MPEKNQIFKVEITGITSEGNGVCRIDGMAVFVPCTAVGDVCEVKIVKLLKSYAFGIVNKMISPSPDRIDDNCYVFKQCGGCLFRHISYESECRIKNDIVCDAFERRGGLSPKFEQFLGAESVERYRNKAQYPLAVQNGKAVCGFFAPRSHRVVPVQDCFLQPEIFRDISNCILYFINEKKLPVYNEETNTGVLRHIYIRRGAHSGEIMVCLVVRKEFSRQLSALCMILTEKFPDIKSIIMNINSQKTNVILGNECVTLWGSDTITDTMCGKKISISPLSFYQVNTFQAERLYAKALEYAQPQNDEVIADLYCGAGTIGLSMAEKAAKIIGVEIIPQAVENAKENAAVNGITNAEFFCGDTGKVFGELRRNGCSPDIFIIDPPRKGCSAETIDVIAEAAPKKVVMISCNPATAARDAKLLSERGFSVEKVCGVDLFPKTGHVETVVLMSRKAE